jgi:hypothetical protein
MLGLDEEKQKQHAAEDKQEAQQERQQAISAEVTEKREHAIAADGDRPTTEMQAQMGRMMRGEDVRAKLRKLNSNFHFEVSKAEPSRTGIYLRYGVSNMDTPSHKGLRFLMGMEREICPEFSVRFTKEEKYWDEHKECEATRSVFAGEMRGWRTVLARLIQQGHVGYAEAIKEFGDSSRSKNWHTLIH